MFLGKSSGDFSFFLCEPLRWSPSPCSARAAGQTSAPRKREKHHQHSTRRPQLRRNPNGTVGGPSTLLAPTVSCLHPWGPNSCDPNFRLLTFGPRPSWLPLVLGCNSLERVAMRDFLQASVSDASRLERVFNFWACFLRGGGLP